MMNERQNGQEMQVEPKYVLWGLPKGQVDRLYEVPLLSEATKAQVERVKVLASEQGFHGFRAVLLNNSLPDFVGAIRGLRRR